ncbi:MAG: cation diffusion facilitator family transporter [Bacteroidales bacterium]|jgi:cation diffusion facilitator family transporter|nr:cation diffusion facilitator family transporter [Bacteroidales bacterium]
MDKKARIAAISIFSNSLLTLLKLIVGLLSGSVSILSEAIHSAMDLLASVIAFIAVRISAKEPDIKHPYGHGKYENISGVLEGLLIFIAAIWIIYEAIHKLIKPEEISSFGLAMGVMLFSAVINFFVSRQLYKVAKETNSIALEADALHLKTDVYTSLGVSLGILLIWLTGITIFDPIFAIAVALLIIKEAYQLIQKAFNPLIDAGIDSMEYNKLNAFIKSELPPETCIINLRSRQNGSLYIIDFVLKVPPQMSVRDAHNICDKLELSLRKIYIEVDINIHVEPKNE